MSSNAASRRGRQRDGRRPARRGGARARRRVTRSRSRVFGDEPYGNYNRILLSSVLAGSHQPEDIFINPLSWYAQQRRRAACRRCASRRSTSSAKQVVAAPAAPSSRTTRSSSPPAAAAGAADRRPARRRPARSRTASSSSARSTTASAFCKRAEASARAVVIGGGLLGLEAARGLLNRGLEVHVVHLMPHVMDGAARCRRPAACCARARADGHARPSEEHA